MTGLQRRPFLWNTFLQGSRGADGTAGDAGVPGIAVSIQEPSVVCGYLDLCMWVLRPLYVGT